MDVDAFLSKTIIIISIVIATFQSVEVEAPVKSFSKKAYFEDADYVPEIIMNIQGHIKSIRRDISDKQAFEIADSIYDFSFEYDIDPKLLMAVIHVESYWNHKAVSRLGAKGLMQIMLTFPNGSPMWVDDLIEEGIIENREDIFKIRNNIQAGAYILRYFMNESSTLERVLVRYYGARRMSYIRDIKKQLETISI